MKKEKIHIGKNNNSKLKGKKTKQGKVKIPDEKKIIQRKYRKHNIIDEKKYKIIQVGIKALNWCNKNKQKKRQ